MATGVRIFLNINNLSPKGESTDAAYQNWIELIDYKMTVKNQSTVSSGTTGSGAGRAVFEGIQPIHPFPDAGLRIRHPLRHRSTCFCEARR
jgi:type VI protein secretion system component Hcp